MKQGQGLSMQVVIMGIIAILVMVVLILIFSGAVKDWISGTDSIKACSARGGGSHCVETREVCDDEGGTAIKLGCPEGEEDESLEFCCWLS